MLGILHDADGEGVSVERQNSNIGLCACGEHNILKWDANNINLEI